MQKYYPSISVPFASRLAILDALMANITTVTKTTPTRVTKRAKAYRTKNPRNIIVIIKLAIPSNINARPASLLITAHISGFESVECVLKPNAR